MSLDTFYEKKLLEPGWAGELDIEELGYIRYCLKRSWRLRRKWGFPNKRINKDAIRERARNAQNGAKMPVSGFG